MLTGYRHVEHLMGTVVSVTIRDFVDPAAVDEAFAEMRRIEDVFSTFLPDSEISRIGRGELDLRRAPTEVRDVLEVCDDLVARTGGRFQHRPDRPGAPPLDPAAYVKGWAGDQAALVLERGGAVGYSINVGGDVLSAGGTAETPWHIGVRHPDDAQAVAAVLPMAGGAAATSGSYERGDHIRGTGTPVAGVTVVGPELGLADALSTAVFAGGVDDLAWFEDFPDYELLYITDQVVRWTPGLEDLLAGPLQVGKPA